MFLSPVVEPVLSFPTIFIGWKLILSGKPVGSFPPCQFTHHGTVFYQPVMKGRSSNTPGSILLAKWEVIGEQQSQGLGYPMIKIGFVSLKGFNPGNINITEIKGLFIVLHPLGQGKSSSPGRSYTYGIKTTGNKIVLDFGGLPQIIGIVGSEAFRSIEKRMYASTFQYGHPVYGHFQYRFKMVKILRELIELKIFWDSVHTPGLGDWFKCANQKFAGIFLVIGMLIRNSKNRQAG